MKTTNRREIPRIDIKLRRHVTSPALGAARCFGQGCIHWLAPVIRGARPEQNGMRVALRIHGTDFRSFSDRLGAIEARQPLANSWMA